MKLCFGTCLRNLIIGNQAILQIQAASEILPGISARAAVEASRMLVNEPAPLKSSLAGAVRKHFSFQIS